MAQFGSKILNNSVSALSANQAALAVIGNNIANVNTPGYTRRNAELETRPGQRVQASGIDIGSGVQAQSISRASDQYLEGLLRTSIGAKAQDELKNDYMSRIDALFDLSGNTPSIGTTLNAFFDSLNQLSLNPASVELRANVIERGNDLTNTINLTYDTIATTQTELDTRLTSEVESINSVTAQIAGLNGIIGQRESNGEIAADQRDQRDLLLNKLAEKVGFNAVESSNGMVTLTLDNGFPLVQDTNSRKLSLSANPSFAPGNVPPSLEGGVLRYIVYDYSGNGTSQLDLTQSLKNGGGAIGGILQLRGYAAVTNTTPFQADGALVAAASRVEAITRQLLTAVNRTYLHADESPTSSTTLESDAVDLNGNQVANGPFALFDFDYPNNKDLVFDGVPDNGDLNQITATDPSYSNYSSRIKFGVTTPEAIAAGWDLDATENSWVGAEGDGRNIQALVAMRTASVNFSTGSFSLTSSTFTDAYSDLVTYVGNAKSAAELNAKVSSDSYLAAATRRDQVSAVSLDEEFTKLIQYQKAFQASARMVKIADDLLSQIVQLI